jgi:hypothetical protein
LYAPWACEDERCVKVFRVWGVVLIFSLIGTVMKSKIDGRDMKSVRELTVLLDVCVVIRCQYDE